MNAVADHRGGAAFLIGGGTMGAFMRAHPWAATPLGPPEAWPQPLKMLAGVMLAAGQPMFVAWGPARTLLYNDAYAPMLADRHPAALGRPFLEVWSEASDDIKPLVDQVFAGEPVHMADITLFLDRPGRPREAHFAFSYTPVRDESGQVVALFCPCTETTEQVLADRRSAAAAERQRVIFQQMPGFVGVLSGPQYVYEYVNDAYIAMFGRRDFIGRAVRDVFPEVEGQGFFELLDGVYSSGEPYTASGMPIRLAGRQGERFIDFLYQPVRDDTGTITSIVVAGQDVTERFHADAALRAAADKAQFLAGLGHTLLQATSGRAVMAYAVEKLGQHLGADRVGYGEVQADDTTIVLGSCYARGVAPLEGHYPLEGFGPATIAEQRTGLTHACADVTQDAGQDQAVWAAIQTRAFASVPLVRSGRFVASLYVNFREPHRWTPDELALIEDVAARTWAAVERARAEAALRDLNADLERQVRERAHIRGRTWEVTPDLMGALNTRGYFETANPAWTTVLGWSDAEVAAMSIWEMLHPDDLERTREVFALTQLGQPAIRFPNRYRCRDGSYRWISWVGVPEGGLVYSIGRDITEEKQAEAELARAQEALRQAQKMEAVGQLTGGIAHDFNNLLAGISGSLELLDARLAQGRYKDLERYISAAQGSARRAATLTQRLLAFSRRQTLDPKPTDVNRLIGGMEELIRRTLGPGITLEVVGAGGLWPTLVDAPQLENALLNLSINARDALPDGGRVTIETANKWLDARTAAERDLPPGQYISLCVTDTGTGMTQDVIDKAFDPFFTTKPIGQGTGLGLSMIHGFVRQSGGQVRIYSEVASGTTMCLYFPRFQGEAEADHAGNAAAHAEGGRGETVLVIDDEPTVRLLMLETLDEAGYHVLEAADGPGGLKVLGGHPRIDLLITDVGLPGGMNGRQVADAARIARPALKVLFVTGYAENAVVGNGHLDRGMEVISKPFALTEFTNRVRKLIEE